MKVPFLDLKAQYSQISEEVTSAFQQVMGATAFSGGPYVEQFEEQFASFSQCSHAVGVGSGTEALWLTLLAIGVGPGDEVITVPNTFIATAEAISLCGAKPVFVDVDEKSFTMNPDLLEAAITKKTKAVIPVHLYGQMADMDPILNIAKKNRIFVIEDACQAHGAEYKGKRAGSIGDAGCFSFYPGKNLGAYGEAGGVVTNNPDLANKVKKIRDHGQSRKYFHDVVGVNSRMDGLQGAVLGVKLKYLPSWNMSRIRNAELYCAMLSDVKGIKLPVKMDYAYHVYHIFAVQVPNRDQFLSRMTEQGIGCGIHYPVPVHLQEAYSSLKLGKGSFPVAEKIATEMVSLPMFPELKQEQIKHVVDSIRNFINH